jgi:predicted dehydrogenase
MKKLNIVILGCGNVAEHFAYLMQRHHHCIVEIYHPEIQKATHFASTYQAKAISNIQTLSSNADLYIIAVKDNAIAQVANELPENTGIVVHTSGNTATRAQ